MDNKPSLLYLTDLYYAAKGRNYYEEDIYITSRLAEDFEILICHPQQCLRFIDVADLIVFRNTGPVSYYKEYFRSFFSKVNENKLLSYNSMNGKADMKGKEYLVELTKLKYPVIPTIDKVEDFYYLPDSPTYILKLLDGSDSIGMKIINKIELQQIDLNGFLLQPFIDFQYEVSFYFIDKEFQYSLYAPDKKSRWDLQEYNPTSMDLIFAKKFIDWNTITSGIQRVDACRTFSNELLLVELEDLNPFLSLSVLTEKGKKKFIQNFKGSLKKTIVNHS